MYNILWIDDEWDKMTAFKQECEELHDLHLEPFRTRKEGIEALEKDLDHWHAVLLDAKMFDETENEVAKLTGLRKAKERLDQLSLKKVIPYFISTGQPDLLGSENFKESFGDYFEKGKDDIRLIEAIIDAIKNSDTLQINHLYKNVFDALNSLGIYDETKSILMAILLPLHFPAKDPQFKPAYHYNQLRQLLEYIFRACHKVGLIPEQCMSGSNINLNQCSIYLAGKDATIAGVRYGQPGEKIVPDYIEYLIRSILEFGNTHSHTVKLSETDQFKIDDIFRAKESRYIIFGLTMHICEVLTWFADYICVHNDKEINRSYCTLLTNEYSAYNGREMEPIKDENGIWHCDECVVAIKTWTPGRKMRLKDVQMNTRETKGKYPYFAKFDKF